MQVLVAARVFLGHRVNLQEKYDCPKKVIADHLIQGRFDSLDPLDAKTRLVDIPHHLAREVNLSLELFRPIDQVLQFSFSLVGSSFDIELRAKGIPTAHVTHIGLKAVLGLYQEPVSMRCTAIGQATLNQCLEAIPGQNPFELVLLAVEHLSEGGPLQQGCVIAWALDEPRWL